MIGSVVALFAVLLFGPTWEEDTLKRFDGPLMGNEGSGYDELLRDYFAEVFADDVPVRELTLWPYGRQVAVGIVDKGKGDYRIIRLEPDGNLHVFELTNLVGEDGFRPYDPDIGDNIYEPEMPQSPDEIPILRCELAIEKELAEHVIRGWRDIVMDARDIQATGWGRDGATSFYSVVDNGQNFGGYVWSSYGKERVAALGSLSNVLDQACLNGELDTEKVQNLADKLNAYF